MALAAEVRLARPRFKLGYERHEGAPHPYEKAELTALQRRLCVTARGKVQLTCAVGFEV